jgi:hypothetical protein
MDLELILEVAGECCAIKPHSPDGNPDGYDQAIVGITDGGCLVYSKEKIIEIAMQNTDMEYEEAIEFLDFNLFCTYVGEQTPIYVNTYSL